MHRVQRPELLHDKEPAEAPGAGGVEEVLPAVQQAPAAQGIEVVTTDALASPKQSWPARVVGFLRDVRSELRKVTWPTWDELKKATAGHENKVRSLIERRIKDDPRPEEEKPIRQALVPTQEVVEIKNGKKVTAERKIYPGYVLVNMVLNQETIHVINGIQGVIKFVGTGRLPMPLRPDEVNRLLGIEEAAKEEEPQETIPFLIGQVVEITEGPFSDFSGTVEEVIPDKGKVRVAVSLFGRPTSVELDYLQLKAH